MVNESQLLPDEPGVMTVMCVSGVREPITPTLSNQQHPDSSQRHPGGSEVGAVLTAGERQLLVGFLSAALVPSDPFKSTC